MTGTNDPDGRIYTNSPEPLSIKILIVTALVLVFFGIFAITKGSLNGLFLLGIAGTMIVFEVWREYAHNPIEVRLGPSEMHLLFRWSSPMLVRYDDIVWLALPFKGRIGGIKIKGRFSFEMNLEICLEIRNGMNDDSRLARPGGI
ncbi:MAG TPA: hypothetical protein VGK23_00395 [Methanomassiliicoccales archaeon]|jgi:hypothetical protein